MMRVCFPFVGDTVGGSHLSALELIKTLPREEVEPVVVVHCDGPLSQVLNARDVGFEAAPNVELVNYCTIPRQLVNMVSVAPRLAHFLRSRKIDIVHTNDSRMHLTWGPAARLAGARFVWHQRSTDPSRRLSLYSHLANEVLTVSHFCKEELSSAIRRRASVVTNPFDTSLPTPDRQLARTKLLDALDLPSQTRVVGYFSNFLPSKRPDIFVNVAARLREHVAFLACPMFGDPRDRMKVDALIADMKLEKICPIMGFRDPIGSWMASCDVMLALAVGEPYGRTLVESMIVGTPVVAAADGGHVEIITQGETGLLVEPDNVKAFETAVMQLLTNPDDASALAERARAHALKRYSSAHHAKIVADIYRGLESRAASRRG